MNAARFLKWSATRGVAFDIKNRGEHWIFSRDSDLVEYWPSTGKLVANKQWRKARQAHGEDRLMKSLSRAFPPYETMMIRPAYLTYLERLIDS